jgi:hypothetical protein
MENRMRRSLIAAACLLFTGTAFAQTQSCTPNSTGGMYCYGPKGLTRILPNGAGGYNSYGPEGMARAVPDGGGGFITFDRGSDRSFPVNPGGDGNTLGQGSMSPSLSRGSLGQGSLAPNNGAANGAPSNSGSYNGGGYNRGAR